MDFRHERKYICTGSQLALIQQRLLPLTEPDAHDPQARGYLVRTVYFDDVDDRYLKENYYGFDNRVKYRVRSYNLSDRSIRLEAKNKRQSLGTKYACDLTRGECVSLLAGDPPELTREIATPLRKLGVEMLSAHCQPKVLIEYERLAFVSEIGNVRITFDRNVVVSNEVERFFEEDIMRVPVLEDGLHILEVKYDELLPSYFADALAVCDLMQSTCSKYVLGRQALLI